MNDDFLLAIQIIVVSLITRLGVRGPLHLIFLPLTKLTREQRGSSAASASQQATASSRTSRVMCHKLLENLVALVTCLVIKTGLLTKSARTSLNTLGQKSPFYPEITKNLMFEKCELYEK